jgi:O-antigen/teichoic acid export membrane protein
MFGVMTLANVLLAGMQLFSDIGLRQNIVQSHRGGDPTFLNTVWTVQIARGVFIWLLMLLTAAGFYLGSVWHLWPVQSVYADPMLAPVVTVLAFNALIFGFESTKIATASRALVLGRMTLIDLSSNLAGVIFMISFAMIERSIWSLVLGTLLTSALRTMASHLLLPGVENRLHWDSHSAHEIFHFGKWVILSSIFGFLAANGDRLMLGWLTSPATLGIFSIASTMVIAVRDLIMQLGGSVAYPALSEIARERRESLKNAYYRIRLPLDVVALLSTGIFLSAGHLLIQFLYDSRYHDAGHMIEILCIALFEVRYVVASQCFMALGLPKLMVPIIFVRLVALFGLMPAAYAWWGLDGALWVVGGSTLFTLPITFYLKMRQGLFDPQRELVVLPLLGVGYGLGLVLDQAVMLAGRVP